jgi:hypothetical protein
MSIHLILILIIYKCAIVRYRTYVNSDADSVFIFIQPPMSEARVALINQAFEKADRTGDDVVTVEDLKGVYSVDKHPKYIKTATFRHLHFKTYKNIA